MIGRRLLYLIDQPTLSRSNLFAVLIRCHVIGFGLSEEEGRQVACLAENTGGLYIQAGSTEELTEALTATVEAPVVQEAAAQPAQLPEASLDAPDTAAIGARIDVAWQGPAGRYDQIQFFDPAARNGEGKALRSKAIRNGDFDNNKVIMEQAPGL